MREGVQKTKISNMIQKTRKMKIYGTQWKNVENQVSWEK